MNLDDIAEKELKPTNNDLDHFWIEKKGEILPDGWAMVEIGKIMEPDRVKIKKESYDGKIPLVKKLPFKTGKVIFREKNETGTDLLAADENHLITSKINFHQGAIAITEDYIAATTHYEFYKVFKNADIKYLWYYFRSNQFKRLFEYEIKFRGFKKEANYDFIKNFTIPLPIISEQQKIVNVLSTIQKSCEATEKVIESSISLKKSLMAYLFTYGMSRIDEISEIAMKDNHEGIIRDDWDLKKLSKIIDTGPQNGLYKPQTFYGDGTFILRIEDYPNEGGIVETAKKRVSLSEDEIQKYKLNPDEILINRVNSLSHIGKVALVGEMTENMVFESNMMRFAVNETEVLPEYIFRFLASSKARVQMRGKAKRAVSQSSINQGDVKSLIVPVPSLAEQKKIILMFSSIDQKIQTEINRRDTLSELFKTIQKDLFNVK